METNTVSLWGRNNRFLYEYTLVYYSIPEATIMNATTIKLHLDTKTLLNQFREYRNESYDEIVKKLVYIAKTAGENPRLSEKTVKDIEEARERLKKGDYYTEEQVSGMLGL